MDEEAAEVVREIFELYVHHAMGTKQIALQLQAEKRIGVEYHKKIRKGIAVTAEDIYLWNSGTIAAILKRQEYVGDTVNFRTQIASYKNKTVIYNESDKIKIFPDTHPAIISRELFQMAQDRREKTIRHPSRPHKYLLVIICIVWTVTQECTAEDVGQKVKMLFIAMSVQLTGKAKGVTSMVFLRNILKPRSYRQFRE